MYDLIKDIENLTGNGLSKIALVIILSLIFYWSHSKVFEYLKNKGSVFLTLMLPVIILIVTQTISTNLYLSLGLIGALSIVRYRTPVKSQYELAYIFGLIAIGLVAGVNPVYAAVLTFFLSILPLVYVVIKKIFPKLKNLDYKNNSEGIVEVNIISSPEYDIIKLIETNNDSKLLRYELDSGNKEVFLVCAFKDLKSALDFKELIKKDVKSIAINNS
tara:strand:+ start:119 stop:769 length:651 start_codon:yes stop_codon:yes gene_type:complete